MGYAADRSGRAAGAARADPAAHRGADDRVLRARASARSRRSCAADSGPAGGRPQALRHCNFRAGHRAVPKIPLDSIPHRAVFEPQLAEQLVEVPTPVTHVGRSLFTDRHGHEWCRVMGPTRAYWWRVGTPHTQWAPPRGS